MILLQLRNELWKLFGKKRTYIGFAMFLLAQAVILLVFRFSKASTYTARLLETNGYDITQFLSPLTAATFTNFWLALLLLLPLFGALVGGDLVAKEAEDGTLRLILARPISRLRLLALKWVAGSIFSCLLCLMLGFTGVLLGMTCFQWGGLFYFVPGEAFAVFPPGEGLLRFTCAHAFMSLSAISVMGLSFFFGCFQVKPAAATILALSLIFLSFIMMNIPWFNDLKPWFLTYHLNLWQQLYNEPVQWSRIGESLFLLLGMNATFFTAGVAVFSIRDIKS